MSDYGKQDEEGETDIYRTIEVIEIAEMSQS